MASYERRVEPELVEVPRLNDWVEACCAADGIGDDVRFKVMLAVEEAVTNAINHAFAGLPAPRLVTVRLDITAVSVVAAIVDNGHPFDPTRMPGPDLDLPLEQRIPGGLGIHLMRSVVDQIEYRRTGGNNILRREKSRG